jgi:hypothetical protein
MPMHRRTVTDLQSPLYRADYETLVHGPATDRKWRDLAAQFLLDEHCNTADDESDWKSRVRRSASAEELRGVVASGAVQLRLRTFDRKRAPAVRKENLQHFLTLLLRPMAQHLAGQEAPMELVEEYPEPSADVAPENGIFGTGNAPLLFDAMGEELFEAPELLAQLAKFRAVLAKAVKTQKQRSTLTSATDRLETLINELTHTNVLELTAETYDACCRAMEFLSNGASKHKRLVYTYTSLVLDLAGLPGRTGNNSEEKDRDQAGFNRVRGALRRLHRLRNSGGGSGGGTHAG